ncbi:hypothetical protein IE3_03158 [Bacillus cereus BAG3X2-1]|nr:hypothetical protein IE3_03158 [Bacillus cereus BAG3X2-1]
MELLSTKEQVQEVIEYLKECQKEMDQCLNIIPSIVVLGGVVLRAKFLSNT